MDIKRFTSAILGFPVVALILISGNKYLVDIAVAFFAMLGLHEYFNAVSKDCKPVRWVGYLSTLLIAGMHIIPMEMYIKILFISLPVLLLSLFSIIIITDMNTTFKDICYTLFGILINNIFINIAIGIICINAINPAKTYPTHLTGLHSFDTALKYSLSAIIANIATTMSTKILFPDISTNATIGKPNIAEVNLFISISSNSFLNLHQTFCFVFDILLLHYLNPLQ